MNAEKKVHFIQSKNDGLYIEYYCYGCKMRHSVPVVKAGENPNDYPTTYRWQINGSEDRPSVTPSVRHTTLNCHYFIRNGYIEYCMDSKHAFAGKPLEMAPYNEDAHKFDYEEL